MTNNESGRSMVEMLGVLAIIGVLSVGGIAGYTMAMRKHKANELMNAASMMLIYCQTNDCGSNPGVDYYTAYLNGDSSAKLPGSASSIKGYTNNGVASVDVNADSVEVAHTVGDMVGNASGMSAYTSNNSTYVQITAS